jgi:hypothetical protein
VKHDDCGRRRHFKEQDSPIVRVVLGCGVPAIFQLRPNAGRSTWTGSSKASLLGAVPSSVHACSANSYLSASD